MKDLIYLINGAENLYKIGITSEKGLKTRMKHIQTGNPCVLTLTASYKTKYASLIERTLHRELISKRKSGEWFELSNEDVFTFTERCSTIEKNIDLLKDQNNHYILKTLKQ